MFRHAIVLAVAVLVALGVAQQVIRSAAPTGQTVAAVDTDTTQTGAASDAPPSAAQVVKSADGHYWAEADIDGRWIHCLVDTGATSVALTQADARRLGLDVDHLIYDAPVMTANGRAMAAKVQLGYVSVAQARVQQVPALVVADGLSTSLLGMSYLGRLSRFEATPTSLILRP